MYKNDIKKDSIRKLLTPDVTVCNRCLDKYKAEISCNICGIIMLKPSYEGRVYKCSICGELYCENCWNKKAGD